MSQKSDKLYEHRRRRPAERVLDVGFKNLIVVLAAVVALLLFAILYVVFSGGLDSMGRYGWDFLVTSSWNPVDDEYGAGAAIYGTLITSLLALIIAVPLALEQHSSSPKILSPSNSKYHRFDGRTVSSHTIRCFGVVGTCGGTIHTPNAELSP